MIWAEKKKAYMKAYDQRPEVIKRRRIRQAARRQRPDVKAKKLAYQKVYQKVYRQRPEVKERDSARHKTYYLQPRIKERERVRDLQQRYGITAEAFLTMLAQQGFVCAACGLVAWDHAGGGFAKLGKRGPKVDHDHATGIIRGILCGRCNMAIGLLRDDPKIIRAVADYLEKSKGDTS